MPILTHRSRGRSAALVTAALVVGALACSMEPAAPFVVPGSGSLAGLLFLDRDGNGIFDPSAGDSALPNVHLLVQLRGTNVTVTGGDVHTDANGRFTLTKLPPGTQSLLIDTAGIGAVISFCTNPLPVTIYPSETQFVSIDGRGGCVVAINVAEGKALGTHVTIRGIVTSTLSQISSGTAYIEDATGGVQLFSPTGPTFKIGDVIEVAGTMATFSNELEVTSSVVNSVTAGIALTPTDATTLQASAASDLHADLQGRLIRLKAAKLLDAFTTGGGRNAQINDGSGIVTVRFDSHVVTDTTTLKTTFTVGKCYNWTGILKAFTGPAVEHFPRSLTDVTEVTCQ